MDLSRRPQTDDITRSCRPYPHHHDQHHPAPLSPDPNPRVIVGYPIPNPSHLITIPNLLLFFLVIFHPQPIAMLELF